jgi:REP element-mobilizing transposase RayT
MACASGPKRKRIRLPPAVYRSGAPFLLTVCAVRRCDPFRDRQVALRVAARLDAGMNGPQGGVLHAWCLMPDHVHVVIAGAEDVIGWVCAFKSVTMRDARAVGWIGRLWQRSFHDRCLDRSGESVERAVRYIVDNPVRAGLVDDVRDWPYWRMSGA